MATMMIIVLSTKRSEIPKSEDREDAFPSLLFLLASPDELDPFAEKLSSHLPMT